MPDKIRWGIISTANIGRRALVPALHNATNGELVAVCSRDLAKARAFADELNIPRAYGSYEEMLADPDIDAVYNPLPNDQHATWSIRAAAAGKHVLCEKPLTADAAEAEEMVKAFKAHGRLLAEAFMYRFHPRTRRVRELVQSGAIGAVQTMASAFTFRLRNEVNIRLEGDMAGGSIMDVGCYAVGVMRFVTGEEPVAVNAYAHYNSRGADELATGTLVFPSGALGHFDSGVRAHGGQWYDIRGSEGRIFVDNAFVAPKDQVTTLRFWHGDQYEEIEFEPVDQYQLMAEDFADAILNDRPPLYPPEDAVAAMRLMDSLRASAQANQSVMPAQPPY
jgi:xylose dehydrogenase (NAD/NADP)